MLLLRRISGMMPGKISRKELKKKMESGDEFTLVDARSPDSYREERIKGAISLPLEETEKKAEGMLGKDEEIIVYCGGFSCPASGNEVRKLREMGFKNVRHYAGGIKDWKEAGCPTETG